MKRSNGAAALLSALVFPGVGQWYQRRRRLALLFALPALVAGFVYLNFALDEASAVADQVLSGAVALDPAAIAAKVEAQPSSWIVTLSGWVFVVCWVGSVVETLVGKKQL
ncbi:hypothetical protein AB595_18330 [Massilia sp. WF1]|uniref:hypothetical protein n=1 Tax=unclassified Massilia TaxID=2609279 RepID=UPI000649B72E|nr:MULTISPECIES: hypothetical protein [unclassified Massilia]ALK97766.1 hypothetical protein AM586_17720 [Massilia sp. WG5]KLU35480.1 hypothetical protein AB595_18330 [Massilia sp. WF1]